MKNNHKNLTIKGAEFKDLPKWFRQAVTTNAVIVYQNNILTWEDGIWEDGTWERGIWERGIWERGIWERGYKSVGFCHWNVYYSAETIKIGCKEKTVSEWDEWFASNETFETERNTEQFEKIRKSYLLAKYAIELGI